jgi:hypothetical protein
MLGINGEFTHIVNKTLCHNMYLVWMDIIENITDKIKISPDI